jgi:hypothetical protein
MGSIRVRTGLAMSWKALCCLLAGAIMPVVASAQYTPAFGPEQFARTAGPPNQFVEQFQQCGTAGCQLVVVNGNADGSDRVSSAWIYLNGVEILGPSDFDPQTGTIITPVSLAASNTLEIKLASAPGSFLTVEVECVTSPATLSAVAPGDSLLSPSTLATALTFRNTGTGDAQNVSVSMITLTGGTVTSPTPLPFNLGTISADGAAVLYSDFSGLFAPSSAEVLGVSGTYTSGGASYCFNFTANFTIPKASPGSSPLQYVQATSNTVSGGGFPPVTVHEGDDGQVGWTTPIGPIRVGTPPPPTTESTSLPQITGSANGLLRKTNMSSAKLLPVSIGSAARAAMSSAPHNQAPASPPPVVSYRNIDMYAGDFVRPNVPQLGQGPVGCLPDGVFGVCAEPSGAAEPGGTVFATSNWLDAWSVDGIFGSGTAPEPSFHPVDPTTVFPADAIGFCCDQVVQYAPTIDRFIWVIQGPGGYRLAVSYPPDIVTYAGTRWVYWNLSASLLASPFNVSNPGVDYPDLSIGNNYVYLSWDLYTGSTYYGHQVARIPLAGLKAGGTIQIGLTDPADGSMSHYAHLSQNTLDAVYWAGHYNSSTLRVLSMKEGDNSYSWNDVQIPSFNNNPAALSSTTPDGRDWMKFLHTNAPQNGVIGATRVLGTPVVTGNGPPPETYDIWFAWMAGPIGTLPNPYIALVEVDQNSNFVLSGAIWNPDLAYGYPALATNLCTQEVGVSLVAGGNGSYQHHDVEFLDDATLYPTTNSNVGATRWGDYVTIRQAPPTTLNPGNLFLAFGFGFSEPPPPPVIGDATSVRYVVFGRPSSSCTVIQ